MSHRSLRLLVGAAFLAFPAFVSAQALPIPGTLSVAVSPEFPAPYSSAILTFTSSTIDLQNATLTVKSGSKTLYQGDAGSVSVSLGAAGKPVKLLLTVTSNGQSFAEPLTLTPQDVVLIAEPESSAPPLYPGKPLVPEGGATRLVAVANLRTAAGAALKADALSYTWSVDSVVLQGSSGIGRNTVVVPSPLPYRVHTVSVTAKSQDGSLAGGASLTLSTASPLVRLYENDPLRGVRFDHALGNTYTITGSEAALYAAAYNFPIDAGAPLIQWFLSGATAQTGPLVTLRPSGTGTGSATLSASVSAGDSNAGQQISVIFGSSSGSSLFGL